MGKDKDLIDLKGRGLDEASEPANVELFNGAAPALRRSFYNMPDSPASNAFMEVLSAGENIADLPERKKQVTNNGTYEVRVSGNSRQVIHTSEKATTTIELADIEKLTGSNKPAKKLFVLALIKANEQAIFDGKLTQDYISFPLKELVDTGFYSAPRSAREGFKAGMDILTSLKIKGKIEDAKNKTRCVEALEVLFTGAQIIKGQCIVYFNPRISWDFIVQYFTILPTYYFKLPNRASDLLYYIFYLARQNTKDIAERGYFTIGFRAIQHRLQLPSETGNTRPKQTIKDPIDEALEEIETEHHLRYGNTEFQLLPVYDENASIKEFLDNGYLQVTLKGDFAKTFIDICNDTNKQIEKREKQQARIAEKAAEAKATRAAELEAEQDKR